MDHTEMTRLRAEVTRLRAAVEAGADASAALAAAEAALRDAETRAAPGRALLKLHMTGPRFAEHGVPLELWRDLSTLQELLEALTREVYLKQHGDRKRMPRAFWEKNALMVRAIEPGSATIPLEWNPALGMQRDLEHESCIHGAADLLTQMIEAANDDREPPADFPPKLLSFFDKLGRRLRDDEGMGFVRGGTAREVRYDKQSRRKLLRLRAGGQPIEEEWERDCVVVELNSDTRSFKVRELGVDGAPALEVRYTEDRLFPTLADAHKKNGSTGLRLRTALVVDPVGGRETLKEISERSALELIDLDPDFRRHLDELRQLDAGWFDEREGLGASISPVLIAHVREVIDLAIEQSNIAPPYIYPTIEGGILADWDIGVWRLDCEWTDVGEAYIHAFDVSRNESTVRELSGASADMVAESLGEMIHGCKG